MFKFPIRIQRIIHNHNAADLKDGVIGDDTGDNVWQQNGDAITFMDTKGTQDGCKTACHIIEFTIVKFISLKEQCHFIWKLAGRPFKNHRQAYFFVVYIFRYTLFITG